MNSKELFQQIVKDINVFEPANEAESLAYLVLEHVYGLSRMDVLTAYEIDESEQQQAALQKVLERLKQSEPIQHIMGKVSFYGRNFLVNRNVLIPRQETEELVHLILKKITADSTCKILDIGTGSGIIPITLKKEREKCEVHAIDVSGAALQTAKRNAQLNRAEVVFHHLDILEEQPGEAGFTIWVSNPPYVLEREKQQMEAKVLHYDPEEALFVPDDDPLLFYRRIADIAYDKLLEEGFLYFEINEAFAREVGELMEEFGFKDIELIKDMQGKFRFVRGQKLT